MNWKVGVALGLMVVAVAADFVSSIMSVVVDGALLAGAIWLLKDQLFGKRDDKQG